MTRRQFAWWEEASLALAIWLFVLLALWPRRQRRTAHLGHGPLHLYSP